MKARVFLAAVVLGISGAVLSDTGRIPFWTYNGRLSWGLIEPAEVVIREPSELRMLWSRIFREETAPALPSIDFRREMVVVVGMGQRSHGGFQVRVERIEDLGDRLRVIYTATSPGASCMTTQSLTSPVTLVRMPRSVKPVTFRAQDETLRCS